MTPQEQIEAALKGMQEAKDARPVVFSREEALDDYVKYIQTQFDIAIKHNETFRRALLFTHKAMGEPSRDVELIPEFRAMMAVTNKNALVRTHKAMTAQLWKEVCGDEA